MRIRDRYQAVCALFRARFFQARIPLAVRWQITNRCALRCHYCNVWRTPEKEMPLERMVSILDEMAALGTQTISYSGGEPMLREDIVEILEETKKRGISTEMNSTGAGIPEKLSRLKALDLVKISLDGPEDVHDRVRGKGSFRIAMEAAQALFQAKKRFTFATTLTRHNINETGFLLETARRYNTLVAFQPLKSLYRGVKDVGPLEPLQDDHGRVIDGLIRAKRGGNTHVRNSMVGLEHIRHWPKYPRLRCWAGKVFCILNTDGTLMPCDRIAYPAPLPDCSDVGFARALAALPDVHCGGCGFCGVLELNFLMSFKFDTVKSILAVLKK